MPQSITRAAAGILAAACILLLAVTHPPVSAQQSAAATEAVVDPALLAGLRWRSIGPDRGGRSIAAAGSVARPHEYYFGATGGGVWKTTDSDLTWRPVSDRHLRTSSVGALAAPSNPDVVYAGMGEVALRGNVIQGDGYRTTDGGTTWVHLGLDRTRAIGRVRVHPANADVVCVAALGDPYGPTTDRGVYKSADGGGTWRRVLFRDERTGAVDLVLDPGNPEVLYASLWEVFRTPHSLSSGGPGSGLFKTTDGGESWTELSANPGLPPPLWGKSGIVVSGADSNRLYAIIEAAEGGVFVSDDAGATWRMVNDDRNLRQRADRAPYVYRTRDYGRTWTKIVTGLPSDDFARAIREDHRRRGLLFLGTETTVHVSFDDGERWQSLRLDLPVTPPATRAASPPPGRRGPVHPVRPGAGWRP